MILFYCCCSCLPFLIDCMVCSQPIEITNSKLAYQRGVDKPILHVPCGQCYSCRQAKQNEWILRTYMHYRYYTEKRNGKCFFVTLTYRDEALPCISRPAHELHYHVYRGKPSKQMRKDCPETFLCFNKDDIDKFFNSLRQYLHRKYSIDDVSYFVCCEYGSKNTCRPHYHCLIFVPDCYRLGFPSMDESRCVRRFKTLVRNYWERVQKNGFVIWSLDSKGGAEVTSVRAIKYVGKYVSKDLDFYGKKNVVEFFQDKEKKAEFRRCMPRHWQSQGFGSYCARVILDDANPLELLRSGIELPISDKNGNVYRYPVPKYVKDKLFCDVIYEQHSEVRLNSRGHLHQYTVTDHTFIKPNRNYRDYKLESLALDVADVARLIDVDLSSLGIRKYFRDLNHFRNFVHSYTPYKGVLDYYNFVCWLRSLLGDYDIEDLAVYKCVYRGDSFHRDSCFGVSPNDTRRILDSAYAHLGYVIDKKINQEYSSGMLREVNPINDRKYLLCNNNTDFANFELILSILDRCHQSLSGSKAYGNFVNWQKMRYVKQLYDWI